MTKAQKITTGEIKARALAAIPNSDIKSGEFFTGEANAVRQLAENGYADLSAKESDVYGDAIPPAKHL